MKNDGPIIRSFGIIFFLLIPVLLVLFRYIIGFNGLYGQDAHEYFRYANAIRNYFSTGISPGPFHWTIWYPLTGALLGLITGTSLALQLISISCFCGALYFLFRILSALYGDKQTAFQYVMLFGLPSAYFLRLGICSMSDMMAIFFVSASIYYCIEFSLANRVRAQLLAVLFFSLAVITRDASVVLVVIPVFFLVRNMIVNFSKIFFFSSILIAAIIFFPAYWFHADVHSGFISEWSFSNYFKNDFDTPGNGHLHYRFWNIAYYLAFLIHPAFVMPAVIFFFFYKWDEFSPELIFLMLAPALLYLLFLSGFMLQNDRLAAMSFPLILVFWFPAFERIRRRTFISAVSRKILGVFSLVIQLVLFWFAFNDFYFTNRIERSITDHINKNYPGMMIYSQGMEGPLNSYIPDPNVFSLESVEVTCNGNKLILIQTTEFEKQWKNKRAGGNWYYLQQHCYLRKVKEFENGWDLYEAK